MTEKMLNDREPTGVSTWKALIIVLVLLIVVAGGLWLWKSSNTDSASWAGGAPVDVKTVTLRGETVPVVLDVPGELRAVQQVMLTAEVAGKVSSIDFKAGDNVKAGEVVVQLDTAVERADLLAAKARETFARAQLSRAKELAPTGAMTREVLQQRQAEYDQAKADVTRLEARIRQKRIQAPFDGEIGLRRIDLGEYLNPGDATATLTNLAELFVNFDIPQQQRGNLSIGQSITVFPDAPGIGPLQATINAIEPQVNRDTRNLRVQAIMGNEQHLLQPGMYVSVEVALPAESGTLLLPASAIMTSAYGDTALVVRELNDQQIGAAEYVPVVAGRRIGDRIVVSQGLSEGDVVVTQGQLRVRPGSPIRVVGGAAAGEPVSEGGES